MGHGIVFPLEEFLDGFLAHAVSTHQRVVAEFVDVSLLDEYNFIFFWDDVFNSFFF